MRPVEFVAYDLTLYNVDMIDISALRRRITVHVFPLGTSVLPFY
jgi:hypothetical protein